jgi:asparagine synthase (glutamine-hydrolysing)
MCGICGILSIQGETVQAAEIEAMCATIRHRGPNEGGLFTNRAGSCGLGIRRLSIIDVAGGQQPLHNEEQTVHLVYNGEIYNHRQLRAELVKLGHRPGSQSDAEVVLHGYEAWGLEGLLPRLRGMFAFALWDETRQRLILGRDRFGIKPLYYARYGGRFCFGSEIKTILADPAFPRRVNLAALRAMLAVGFVPGPATMFEGVLKLPPAHVLVAQGDSVEITRYWQPAYHATGSVNEAEATAQLLEKLTEAVHLRLMSEVPLGALLSGGLDSGTLVALMRAEVGSDLKTVSIGFDSPTYDEAGRAKALARRLDTTHHAVSFGDSDFDEYPQLMWHLEEPQCSATAAPIYRLYRACREAGLTVVLTGEGADELFGGYHWHRGDALARPLLGLPFLLRRLLTAAPLPMSPAARRVLRHGQQDTATRYRQWLAVPHGGHLPGLFSSAVTAGIKDNGNIPLVADWAAQLAGAEEADPFHQLLLLESQTRLPDFINFEVDRMSMAHSVEARVPFLDHQLWEFVATLPVDFKLRGRTEKYLLRQATAQLLPEATRTRSKKGLAAPYSAWLRRERLPEWAETALSTDTLKQSGLFNPQAVQRLRQAHQAGSGSLGSLLMGVLSTQVWAAVFRAG